MDACIINEGKYLAFLNLHRNSALSRYVYRIDLYICKIIEFLMENEQRMRKLDERKLRQIVKVIRTTVKAPVHMEPLIMMSSSIMKKYSGREALTVNFNCVNMIVGYDFVEEIMAATKTVVVSQFFVFYYWTFRTFFMCKFQNYILKKKCATRTHTR